MQLANFTAVFNRICKLLIWYYICNGLRAHNLPFDRLKPEQRSGSSLCCQCLPSIRHGQSCVSSHVLSLIHWYRLPGGSVLPWHTRSSEQPWSRHAPNSTYSNNNSFGCTCYFITPSWPNMANCVHIFSFNVHTLTNSLFHKSGILKKKIK